MLSNLLLVFSIMSIFKFSPVPFLQLKSEHVKNQIKVYIAAALNLSYQKAAPNASGKWLCSRDLYRFHGAGRECEPCMLQRTDFSF